MLRLLIACALAANDGESPLLRAAYEDDPPAVDRLLKTGAAVNAANDLGVSPLWAACQNGSLPITKRLLEAGANPNAALTAGETPLMVAARGGYAEIVELLLSKGANPDARATRGQTALMWAVSQRHPDVVRVLLKHGANIHLRSEQWSQMMAVPPHGYLPYNKMIPHGGDTALMFAARVGDLESLRLLVDAGANVNDRDAWGVSALVLAAHSGFREMVDYLLRKDADPNSAQAGFSALHIAIARRDERMARALVEHGANPNLPLKTWTPTRRSSKDFHFAPELVGATPYWLAARFQQPEIMRLLAARGADTKFIHHAEFVAEKGFVKRVETSSPLHAALNTGSPETAKAAIELGAPIDERALKMAEGKPELLAVLASARK